MSEEATLEAPTGTVKAPTGTVETPALGETSSPDSGQVVEETTPVSKDTVLTGDTPVNDWRSNLPEELRDNPNISKFKSEADLAKSYVEQSKLVGAKRMEAPSEDWDDAKWQEHYKSLPGYPETADEYGITRPEGLPEGLPYSEELEKNMLGLMHENGLTKRQAENLFSKYNEAMAGEFNAIQEQRAQAEEAALAELQREWGQEYSAKVADAQLAIKTYGGDSLAEKLVNAGLANDPDFIKAFSAAGATLKEDEALGKFHPEGHAATPTSADIQINELRADPDFMAKYHGKHGIEAQRAARSRMDKLYSTKFRE